MGSSLLLLLLVHSCRTMSSSSQAHMQWSLSGCAVSSGGVLVQRVTSHTHQVPRAGFPGSGLTGASNIPFFGVSSAVRWGMRGAIAVSSPAHRQQQSYHFSKPADRDACWRRRRPDPQHPPCCPDMHSAGPGALALTSALSPEPVPCPLRAAYHGPSLWRSPRPPPCHARPPQHRQSTLSMHIMLLPR